MILLSGKDDLDANSKALLSLVAKWIAKLNGQKINI